VLYYLSNLFVKEGKIMYALNKVEKAYIRRIVVNTRNDYLKREKYKRYDEVELEGEIENIIDKNNNIEDVLTRINDKDVISYSLEMVFEDKKIMKIVKALTLKEKLVLFSYYLENNTDQKIAKVLNSKTDTIKKIRQRALKKIKDNYYKNGGSK